MILSYWSYAPLFKRNTISYNSMQFSCWHQPGSLLWLIDQRYPILVISYMHTKFISNGVYILPKSITKNIAALIQKAPWSLCGVSKGNFALAGSVIQASRLQRQAFPIWAAAYPINMSTKEVWILVANHWSDIAAKHFSQYVIGALNQAA